MEEGMDGWEMLSVTPHLKCTDTLYKCPVKTSRKWHLGEARSQQMGVCHSKQGPVL